MRCEAFEAIVFSGGEVTEAMREHAQGCEACRALMENADVLADAAHLDDDLEVPASFGTGWRAAIRREAAKKKQPTLLERAKALLFGGRRRALRGFAYALCAVTLVGVGAQLGDRPSADAVYSMKAAPNMARGGYAMDDGVMLTSMAYDEAAEEETEAAYAQSATQARKIIRTAQLDVKVDDLDSAMQSVSSQVKAMDGVIGYSEVSGQKGKGRYGSMEVQVPSEQLDSFLAGAGSLGTVTRQSSQQTDMTSQYVDNASRLESAQAQKQRLDELYAQAEDMADIVTITDALFDVQREIDELTGSNRWIDDRVNLSRVYLSFTEPADETKPQEATFFEQLGAHFAGGMEAIGEFFSGMVFLGAWALPWAALIAAIAAVVACIKKHIR